MNFLFNYKQILVFLKKDHFLKLLSSLIAVPYRIWIIFRGDPKTSNDTPSQHLGGWDPHGNPLKNWRL